MASDLQEVIAKWRAMMATDTDPTDPAAIELAQIIDAAEAGAKARDAALEEAAEIADGQAHTYDIEATGWWETETGRIKDRASADMARYLAKTIRALRRTA